MKMFLTNYLPEMIEKVWDFAINKLDLNWVKELLLKKNSIINNDVITKALKIVTTNSILNIR